MYRDNNRSRHMKPVINTPVPNIPLASPESLTILPGESNPSNKPGLIPLFQYMSNLYRQYISDNVNIGRLQVSVASALGGTPIPNAKITISRPLGDNFFLSQIVFTDLLGQTLQVPLPTRSIEVSQTAEYPVPYTTWNLTADAPGYIPVIVYDVPIFPGVVTTQSFSLKPIQGNAVQPPEEIYASIKRLNSLD